MLITYILPAHWASYLMNKDDSGLDEADKRAIAAFFEVENLRSFPIDCSEDSWFAPENDATSLASQVMEFVFDVPPPATAAAEEAAE